MTDVTDMKNLCLECWRVSKRATGSAGGFGSTVLAKSFNCPSPPFVAGRFDLIEQAHSR